jgi:1,2-diacylglycerol 3-alpha-glucosyltransferase
MKAAIFSDTYPPEINGVATSARNLYRTFVNHGDKMLVVTTNHYNNEITQEGDILRIPGIEMKRLYGYRLAGFYNSGAMKIIRDFAPDVIHIQTDGGVGQFGFIAANMIHASTVYTFHTMMEDYTYYATRGFILDRVAKGIVRGYVRYKSRTADEFITPSEKIREYMRNIGVDAYMNVIPTGIDFSAFSPMNIDQNKVSALRKKYGLSPDTYVILSLGRVAKEKSIDLCLRGYAKYLKGKPAKKTLFLIVGGGPALADLKELTHSLGIADNVTFVGPVNPDDVPLYYALGNAFVSASITETQGLTFMEAMASSLILLVRYDDSLLGTIKDGENGFFFLDEDDLANKLPGIIALNAAKAKVVKDNAMKGLEPYSLERFYTSVHEVYERAIKKNW